MLAPLVILTLILSSSSFTHRLIFFKCNETNTYYLLKSNGVAREIKDSFSLKWLLAGLHVNGRNDSSARGSMIDMAPLLESIPVVSKDALSVFEIDRNMPTFKMDDPNQPDEKVRIVLRRIEEYEYPSYWTESMYLPGSVNPAIARWHNGTVVCWRSNRHNAELKFGWMAKNHSFVDFENSRLGLSPLNNRTVKVVSLPFSSESSPVNLLQEDPRILVRSDNSLFVTYSVFLNFDRTDYIKGFKQCYTTGRLNTTTGQVEFSDSILLNKTYDGSENQKNWIPFEYKQEMFFIQSIDPFRLVWLRGEDGDTGLANLQTVYDEKPPAGGKMYQLPWKRLYGLPLRGGTDAILVRGVYLTIFHTVSRYQHPYTVKSYFMGALAFCPHPPFTRYGISSVPLAKYEFYEGKYLNKYVDFALFPSGVMLDEDGDHLWVTFGYQDKHGYIIKLTIDGLMKSLQIIGNCSNDNVEKSVEDIFGAAKADSLSA